MMFGQNNSDDGTVVAMMAQALRRDIAFGTLRPDQKLKIEELRGRYGGSNHSVRETLRLLSAEGLVEATAQCGFRVTSATEEDLRDIALVRKEIERTAIRRAIEFGDTAWEGRVLAAHHALRRAEAAVAASPDDLVALEWDEACRVFAATVLEACGSPRLIDTHKTYFDQSRRFRLAQLREGQLDFDRRRQRQQALLNAILEKDPDAAEALIAAEIEAELRPWVQLKFSGGIAMKHINRRHTLALLGGGVAAAGLWAPAIAQNKQIKVGALRFTSHSASFIAVERGYFADAGLDVELKFFQAAQPMAVAIASGDIDYAVTAVSGGLISLADKGAIKVIGGALREEPGIDGQQIVASDAAFQAGLTDPSQLGGKSYAVTQQGSSFHYVGSNIAKAHGVDVSFKPLQKVGAIIGALRSGQVDAWNIVPHIAKPLAAAGAIHIIGAVQEYLPDYQITTAFTQANNASQQRGQTADFLAAFSQGIDDYNSTMIDNAGGAAGVDAMVRLIHKYVYTDRPLEKAAPSIINGTMRLSPGAALNVASIRHQLRWFQSEGLVDADITMDTLVDGSYVELINT